MTELTATERETLAEAAYLHRTTGAPLGPAVEAILTARRVADALAAPTPDEVQPHTKEENIAFRKAWDARVEAAAAQPTEETR